MGIPDPYVITLKRANKAPIIMQMLPSFTMMIISETHNILQWNSQNIGLMILCQIYRRTHIYIHTKITKGYSIVSYY
jgi:hypothetical protein